MKHFDTLSNTRMRYVHEHLWPGTILLWMYMEANIFFLNLPLHDFRRGRIEMATHLCGQRYDDFDTVYLDDYDIRETAFGVEQNILNIRATPSEAINTTLG